MFVLWPHQEDVQALLDHMNLIIPYIEFTMDKQVENQLAFLDVLITCTEYGSQNICVSYAKIHQTIPH